MKEKSAPKALLFAQVSTSDRPGHQTAANRNQGGNKKPPNPGKTPFPAHRLIPVTSQTPKQGQRVILAKTRLPSMPCGPFPATHGIC